MPRLFHLHRVFLGAAAATLLACAEKDAMSPRPSSDLSAATAALPAGEFNVRTTPEDDQAFSPGSNGVDYMVGVTVGNFPNRIVQARKVFANGTISGVTTTNRKGDPPMVAFGGTNYLMVWNDRNPPSPGCSPQPCVPPPPPVNIYGVLLNTAGAKVGSSFKISTENTGLSLGGIALAGGKFLVTYSVFDISSLTVKLYGRFVTTGGVAGPRFLIASPQSTGSLNNIATDGTNSWWALSPEATMRSSGPGWSTAMAAWRRPSRWTPATRRASNQSASHLTVVSIS
jgi:hypothetical protein